MSVALQEDGHGGFRVDGFGDDRPGETAFAERVTATEYTPDQDAYAFDPANDKSRAFAESIEAGATIELNLACTDGRRERIVLNSKESAAYASAPLEERTAIGNRKIRERRQAVAVSAAQRLTERQQAPSRHTLSPEEEACLREFGALLEDKNRSLALREGAVQKLQEDGGFFDGWGGDEMAYGQSVSPTQREYLPRGGPSGQQQSLGDVWNTLALAYFAWTQDPLAHRGCEIIADFTLGRGVGVVAKHPAVQRVIDEFNDREQINSRLHQTGVSLSRDGELFVRKIPIGDGRLKVRMLPPASIWEIVTDGDDASDVFYFLQRYQTRNQLVSGETPAAQTRWIDRTILASDLLHVKINASETDVRGRSDIHAALGWLKRLRDYFDAVVQKEYAAAAYQFHYKVKGGTADVSRIASAVSGARPVPGQAMVTNDLVDMAAIDAGKGASTTSGSTYAALVNHVALAFGLSKDYFGAASNNSRANALVATEPSAKRFEDRQNVFEAFFKQLYTAVVAEVRKYGKLVPAAGEDSEVDENFRIVFPTIIKADAATRLMMLRQMVGMGWLSSRRGAQESAGEVELSEYDYDDEVSAITEETGEDPRHWILGDVSPVKRGLPAEGDPAFSPGERPNPDDANAVPGDAGDASPTSAFGAAKIRKELGGGAGGFRAAERKIAERGGITIYP